MLGNFRMPDDLTAASENAVLQTLRRLLLAILTVVLAGTATDLGLLMHYESAWQLAPLIMIALALAVVAWVSIKGSARALTALRIVMVLFIATGVLGMLLHYNGNREFQREIDPAAGGWDLFMKVMRAKAPPALAPAVMIQMGMLGLLYTYRHPALQQTDLSIPVRVNRSGR
jgi:hypothetical protein